MRDKLNLLLPQGDQVVMELLDLKLVEKKSDQLFPVCNQFQRSVLVFSLLFLFR